MMTIPLIISFSGGRTSAYMAYLILNDSEMLQKYEPFLVFSNTGCEHEKTLEFIHNFEVFFKWPIMLKLAVINSWAREMFGTVDVDTAIGIRADEMRRVKDSRKIIYPLVDKWPSEKQDILDFWQKQPFDLEIPEHLGNCVWCFKKSDTKLLKALQDAPEYFRFPEEIEIQYANGRNGKPVHFFRQHRDVQDLKNMKDLIGHVSDDYLNEGGCSESCEFLQAS